MTEIQPHGRIGAVVIGRNEGPRLVRCLQSLAGRVAALVYVDSGSTDDSVAAAAAVGAHVVQLDTSRPFTMARGRNLGLAQLRESRPDIDLVHFVDGDCELAPGWVESAQAALLARPDVVIVCGQRRERFPQSSIYNRLCDLEWYRPAGEVRACGGDALMRAAAVAEVSGYPDGMIAGEEGEMCFRLRARGWKVLCLPDLMTLHDAAIFSFRQWWRRAVRTGHAYAEGMALHGASPERYNVRPVRSAILWGLVIPALTLLSIAAAVAAAIAAQPWLALPAAAFPAALWALYLLRILLSQRRLGRSLADALLYTLFIPPAKMAQCLGAATFWANRRRGRRTGLIEYKPVVVSKRTSTADPDTGQSAASQAR